MKEMAPVLKVLPEWKDRSHSIYDIVYDSRKHGWSSSIDEGKRTVWLFRDTWLSGLVIAEGQRWETRLNFLFFLFIWFWYEFLSKLYSITIQPPAYQITTLIYVNSWNQLWLRGTNPYRNPPRGWFGWDNWLVCDNRSRDTQAIPIITRYGGIKHPIVFSLLLAHGLWALTRPVFLAWSLCSRHR